MLNTHFLRKLIFLLLILHVVVLANAQFVDNFDDGSFPTDPNWFGDTEIYTVNPANELQLMDVVGGSSSVYAPIATADSTVWEFFFRLEFDPSTSNQLKVYLNSDSPDFDGPLNGYFLQVGASGSDDAIELRRQDGSSSTLLLSGQSGAVATEPAVRVRVIRNDDADWQLLVDYSGGVSFQNEGAANDNTYNGGAYFGFKCKYSETRKDKFYFDDVFVSPVVEDETPPMYLSALPIDANTIQLQFDEALEETSAENSANYSINNGVIINSVTLNVDPSLVTLDVSDLSSGTTYDVAVDGVEDLNENSLPLTNNSFTYYLLENAVAFDILINEVFPNPDTEVTSLPDAEFIELYNRSEKAINLEDYEIADASNVKTLPAQIMPSQSYLIICDLDNVDLFNSFGNVLGVSGLFSLNDSGDDVSLSNTEGILIHEMTYTIATFQDEDKTSGGWSLELVNPNLYCQGESNWRASVAALGGTPGAENALFDDTPDTTSPILLDAIAISENQVRLFFNETLSGFIPTTAFEIPGTGAISNVSLEADEQTVTLTVDAPFFINQGSYVLKINELLADCSGNSILETFQPFTYFEAEEAVRYDILINEIYPDFSPSFGLPEKEFVELYNRSDKVINLENFELISGDEMAVLPFFLLQPNEYVTVYETGGNGFGVYGDTIALETFVNLSNEGDLLELRDSEGETIHFIIYDKGWYRDAGKSDGGWSIELINPEAPCAFSSNWRASVAAIGGTPGQENSVYEPDADDTPLDLVRAFPLNDQTVILTFNKAVDQATAEDLSNYTVDGLTPFFAILAPPSFNRIFLTFSESFDPNQIYEIQVKTTLTDCTGNGVGVFDKARFALPQSIEANEMIINEVLYDPQTGGARFVELYNRSNKVFNLNDLNIADRDEDGQDIDRNIEVTEDYLIFPGDYIVLTTSPQDVLDRYHVESPNGLVVNALPSWDDKEDAVIIFVPDILGPRIIDELNYTDDFHNALVDDTEGVSLERIRFDGETNDSNNWQSAASTIGFATPTYQNSQFSENASSSENTFDIPNTTFSPDGDGFEDFLLINYNAPQDGWVANIQMFDAHGRLVKRLVRNESLAAEGSFKWEGDTDEGNKARIGIYVVWIELFKANGTVEQQKMTCVIAGQLD